MEASTQPLVACLTASVSADKATRKQAEEQLEQFKQQPQCALTTLSLLMLDAVPLHVRQAGAIFFKNLVRQHWEAEEGAAPLIPEQTKQQVRDGLLNLFLCVPQTLQLQLSEAIALIASHDFPQRWEALLPSLVQQTEAAFLPAAGAGSKDYKKGCGLLQIAHSIFKRYRHEFKSDQLFAEIKYALNHVQEPLLKLFKSAREELRAATQAEHAKEVLQALTLLASLHFDLCAQDLPEYFEDHMGEWMQGFVELLKYSHAGLAADEDDTEPGIISVLHAEIVENFALFMSKYEEEFQPFLGACLGHVWELLVATSLAPHHDLLVTTSIRFLTTVSTSVHHSLFAQAEVLQNVCQKIIAPNMQLLQADVEIFEENPIEYVRRDIEGSDSETRRRVSCDLVRGLCRNYEPQVTALFSAYIDSLLQQHAAGGADAWKPKDVAIYLVIALTIKGGTQKLGATHTNQLVELMDFFEKHVLPELRQASHPVLTADAIKFVTVFRVQLDRGAYERVLPLLLSLLTHKNHVVHTYAASAIERMLTVRESTGQRRFDTPQLVPMLQQLLTSLFGILAMPGSEENAYAMRAIMRVTVVAGEAMAPYANVCIESLNTILGRVCANPSNPTFNHYLFETVASLVRYICAATPAAVDAFEALLFPPFQTVLQMDIAEFTPYVFQVLAQLLECRPALSPAYEALFPPLLTPTMWERPGNIPPLVRLLCAYMKKGKALLAARIEGVLGVFQRLLARRATDSHACRMLAALFASFEMSELQQYMAPIFNLCLTRLQTNKKTGPHMVSAWSVYVARYGPMALRSQFEAIQPGLCNMILVKVWSENASAVAGPIPRKTVLISTARLIAEVPELLSAPEVFCALLEACLLLLLADAGVGAAAAKPDDGRAEEAEDGPLDVDGGVGAGGGGGGGGGYAAAYVQLSFAAAAETDLYPNEESARFFASTLKALGVQHPSLPQLLQRLPEERRQQLAELISRAG